MSFSGENAYEYLRVLAEEIGPRHGASKGEARAARYIRDTLNEFGLQARLQRYRMYSFEKAHATLRDPDGRELSCLPIAMSGKTTRTGVTAPTVFLEGNDPVGLDERIAGKIVVMFGDFRGDAQQAFAAHEPAGLVSIQTRPYTKHLRAPRHADAVRKAGPVPSVAMTLDDGLALVQNLPGELALTVSTTEEKPKSGYNVVADLPGSDPHDDDILCVGAHYDSVWGAPGAVDNGGGAATMMELARVYAAKGTRRNLRFIAFGGEEMGVWGSKSYVKKLADEDKKLRKNKEFERDGLRSELDRHRFLINLDVMGPRYGQSTAVALGDLDIPASVRLLAKELRYPIEVKDNAVYSSDNMTFNYAGIPSVSFYRTGFEDTGMHTVEDTIAHASPEGFAHLGSFIEVWVDRYLQLTHVFPFTREYPQAARDAVAEWYKGKDPLDYEVFGPEKKYEVPSSKKRRS